MNGNGGNDEKTGGKNGSCRGKNGEMGAGSDKKQIRERDRENRIARRQTLKCKAMLAWTREKNKKRLRGKKDDDDGSS